MATVAPAPGGVPPPPLGGLGFVGFRFFEALLGVAWAVTRASVAFPCILPSQGDAGRLPSQSEIKTLCEERGLPKGRPAPHYCSDYFRLMHIPSKASTVLRIEETQVHCSRCSAHSFVTCVEIEAGAEPNFNGSPASVPGHVFLYHQLGRVSHLEYTVSYSVEIACCKGQTHRRDSVRSCTSGCEEPASHVEHMMHCLAFYLTRASRFS